MQRRESSFKKIDNYIFSLDDHLGSGSFGRVYKAIHLPSNQQVAIKVIDISTADRKFLQNLQNEIKLMKQVDSIYTVKLFDTFLSKSHFYLITEYCDQGDLRSFFQKNKGLLSERQARSILKDLIRGLSGLASNGVVHRDLKPENILIKDNVYKIADFGFAKSVDDFNAGMLYSCVGSPLYMSPQVIKKEVYSSKCDIFSLGLLYYEMLFGKTPWPSMNMKELIQKTMSEPLKFPYNIFVTEMTKNFLRGCLAIEEKDRMSLEHVMDHEVFRKKTDKLSIYELDMKKKIELDNKSKEIISKIQKTMVSLNLSIDKLFSSLSLPSSKTLSFSDFKTLINLIDPTCTPDLVLFLFQKLDTDDSKTIDREEFGILLEEADLEEYEVFKDPFLEEKMKNLLVIFKAIVQKSGRSIKSILEAYNDSGELKEVDVLCIFRTMDPSIGPKDIEYIFKSLDCNKDGILTFLEFEKALEELDEKEVEKKRAELERVGRRNRAKEEIKNEVLSKEARNHIAYLKSMVICQSISAEELVRNFSSKKKEYLELADFQRFFSLIARLPMNTPIFREIWDAYSSQSKFGEKEMSVMITSE